jgi:hypothetical protein
MAIAFDGRSSQPLRNYQHPDSKSDLTACTENHRDYALDPCGTLPLHTQLHSFISWKFHWNFCQLLPLFEKLRLPKYREY